MRIFVCAANKHSSTVWQQCACAHACACVCARASIVCPPACADVWWHVRSCAHLLCWAERTRAHKAPIQGKGVNDVQPEPGFTPLQQLSPFLSDWLYLCTSW